jgi:hypothetical protein
MIEADFPRFQAIFSVQRVAHHGVRFIWEYHLQLSDHLEPVVSGAGGRLYLPRHSQLESIQQEGKK